MKTQDVACSVMTLYSDMEGYQRFGRPCCLHLHTEAHNL